MGSMQKIAIVVPCFNEANRLRTAAFLELCRQQPESSFVFVDDGSSDDTSTLLRQLATRAPEQITFFALERNMGKAEAVRRGVLRALESPAELIGFWDADLATPLYNIELFAREFLDFEIEMVVGSRIALLGHDVKRRPTRHYLGRGFATLAAIALRLPIYDTQCGAKMFRATARFREIFAEPFELTWCFDVELLARLVGTLLRQGGDPRRQIVELPLREWVDAPGSKLRARHFPSIAWEMARLFAIARRS